MDDLIIAAQNRIKTKRYDLVNKNTKTIKPSKYISSLFTRTLLSVILILLCAIYINLSDSNLLNFKNKFFNETLAFTKINNLYAKYFGDIIPEKVNKTTPVFESGNSYTSINELDNSYELTLSSNVFNYLESGVVVFIGEKENLGQTVIVQGIDGVDIWYSNLENINVTMYDYVEKDAIVGETKDNKIILTFIENGNYIDYEKYLF